MRKEDHRNSARAKTRFSFPSLPLLGSPRGFSTTGVSKDFTPIGVSKDFTPIGVPKVFRFFHILQDLRVLWALWFLPALSLQMGGCHEYHAQRQLDKGRYKSAIEHLDRSNKKKPYLRAQALKGLKRYEEAYKAALEEVKRYQNRSRGPIKPFILAAELAHQLDYGQECLELLEMARRRGNLKTQHKVIEALRRLDRAEHLLAMGAVVTPTNDVTRAIKLIHDMGIKVHSLSGSVSSPSSSSNSSSGSQAGSNSLSIKSNSKMSTMSKERLESIAYQAWISSAIWAFAMNKKSEAMKWLSKPSTSAEKRAIKGEWTEALIPARRGLKTLIKNHPVSLTTITDITDITSTVSLMQKLGAHEAVVKAVNTKVAVTKKGATKIDASTTSSLLALMEKGLDSAGKTWAQNASWELQKKLATLAEHPETSSALTARFVKILTAECFFWEDSFSPACRSLERIAVKRGDPNLLKHWIHTLKAMDGPGYALGHTAGTKALLKRTSLPTRHDVTALLTDTEVTTKTINKKNKSLLSPEMSAFLHRGLAQTETLRLKGESSRALQLLNKILGKEQGNPKVRLEAAYFFLKIGDLESALSHLTWAEQHWKQSPRKKEGHVRHIRKLILKGLRLKEGPVAVFRKLEEDALTWITQPMTLAEFEKRITENICEFSGHEKPLALIWLHSLVRHLKEHTKTETRAKSRAPGKTTTQDDRGLSGTQRGSSDAQKISTKESLLRVNLLNESAKPLKRTLSEWFRLLQLRDTESLKESALVSRWWTQLPTNIHRKRLMNLLGTIAASPEPASPEPASPEPTSPASTSAAKTSLQLAYYKSHNFQKTDEKEEESKRRRGKKKTTQKTKSKQGAKQKKSSPEKPGDLKKARQRQVEPLEKQAEKLVEKLDKLSKEEINSPVCHLSSHSPTLWQARLLVLLRKPKKAKDTLLLALRTGPKGFGLCRVSSVLSHLQELGLSVENPAHQIASSFNVDPKLLRPAALALVQSPNSGWADLAGEDLIAASPDGGREILKLSRAYLNADRCGKAGKLGIKVFQWVNPSLPAHAPALKLTAQIFARCHRTDRLLARLEYWRRNQGQIKPLHKHRKETAAGIPKQHSFNRALRIVVTELAKNGLKKEALKISRHFGEPSPIIQVSSRAEGSHLHARKDSPPQTAVSLHQAEKDFNLKPLNPLAACRLAELLIKKQAYRKAGSFLNKALLLNPSAYCAHRLMAKLAIEQKNFQEAEEWLAWLIVNKGKWLNSPTTEKETDPIRELAELYLKLRKPHAAVRLYEKAQSCPTQSIQQRQARLESLWSIINEMLFRAHAKKNLQ